ncbi:MAG: hypothetical protein NUV46_00830 [Nanoarchaeota archaeon]|nr:hypothetical protein [Nanoarchaeota archaeon]
MTKFKGLKIFLFLIAILIALWNYFLRSSLNLPYLSTFGVSTVYIISVGVLILGVILHYMTRYSY